MGRGRSSGRDIRGRWVAPAVTGCLTMAVTLSATGGNAVWPVVFLAATVAIYAIGRRRAVAGFEGAARWPAATTAVAPLPPVPAAPSRVAGALARVEARQLLFSAWFGAGLGFLAVIVVAYAVVYPEDNGETWSMVADQVPWFAHPIAGMTILAVHRSMTRPLRDGTEELFTTCPSPPAVRVAAMLRIAVVPVAVTVVFLAVLFLALAVNSPNLYGGLSAHSLASLLAAPVLVVGAAWLGVALGVWARFRLVPVVAVVVIGFLSLRLATAGDPGWNGVSALSTFGPQVDGPFLLPIARLWPYVAWMGLWSCLMALVAVVRFRRDGRVVLVGCGLVAGALVAGVLAVRPVAGGDARRVADLIAHADAHQECTPTSVPVCTFAGYGEFRRRVASAVASVGDALPGGVPAVTVRQAFAGSVQELPPEVRRLLPGGVPEPGAGEVRIGFAGDDDTLVTYRLRVAFQALGLPLPSDADPLPKVIAGEARGVVALWLATRGLSAAEARDLVKPLSGDDAFERGQAWPHMCGPVVWSPQDLTAARSVLAIDPATVSAVVAGGWARWSDPRTGTDDLLAALDLPTAGPYDRVTPRTERFC